MVSANRTRGSLERSGGEVFWGATRNAAVGIGATSPECQDLLLFGKTVLVANSKFRLVLADLHGRGGLSVRFLSIPSGAKQAPPITPSPRVSLVENLGA